MIFEKWEMNNFKNTILTLRHTERISSSLAFWTVLHRHTWLQGEKKNCFLFSPSHYTLPFRPSLKACVCSSDDTHLLPHTHTCSPLHTCKPRPLGLLWLAAARGSLISYLVITLFGSHENKLGDSSHATLLFVLKPGATDTLVSVSPFSDCHQVLRRLWAKVVTTFSMVWLRGLLSSSYISLELHTKHFVSSWWTESTKRWRVTLHVWQKSPSVMPKQAFISFTKTLTLMPLAKYSSYRYLPDSFPKAQGHNFKLLVLSKKETHFKFLFHLEWQHFDYLTWVEQNLH